MKNDLALKWKNIYNDLAINIFAFAIVIFTQQFIVMPYLSKEYEKSFGTIILVYTVMSIISYITGGAVGSTLLVNFDKYKKLLIKGDYIFFLVCIIPIDGFIVSILWYFEWIISTDILYIYIAVILMSFRIYSTSVLRVYDCYNGLLLQGIIYFVICCMVYIFKIKVLSPYFIFFIAEIFSTAIYVKYSHIYLLDLVPKYTSEFKSTMVTCLNFSGQTILNNMVNYADRFLIIPLLGEQSLVVLYCATVVAKCSFILINPVKSVILARLANTGSEAKDSIFTFMLKKTTIIFLPLLIFNLLASYLFLYFIYTTQFLLGYKIVPIIALATVFTEVTELYITVAMRFFKPQLLTIFSIGKLLVFVILAYLLTKQFLLFGFVVAELITSIIMFTCYFLSVRKAI